MTNNLELIEATAPSAWASYLINGDASGLEDDEISQADAFVEFVGAGAPVSCEDAGFIGYSNARDWGCCDYAADCQTYQFLHDARAALARTAECREGQDARERPLAQSDKGE